MVDRKDATKGRQAQTEAAGAEAQIFVVRDPSSASGMPGRERVMEGAPDAAHAGSGIPWADHPQK